MVDRSRQTCGEGRKTRYICAGFLSFPMGNEEWKTEWEKHPEMGVHRECDGTIQWSSFLGRPQTSMCSLTQSHLSWCGIIVEHWWMKMPRKISWNASGSQTLYEALDVQMSCVPWLMRHKETEKFGEPADVFLCLSTFWLRTSGPEKMVLMAEQDQSCLSNY